METKYKLLVEEGSYAEDSLIKLFFTVLKHRATHFLKGEGWHD